MNIVPVTLLSIACAVSGQFLLKKGMNQIGRVSRSGGLRWRAGLGSLAQGLSLYGLSAALWLVVLSRVPLSYAFPFLSLSYVAILAAAHWGLGEELGPSRITGSLLIVLGVLMVSLS